MSALFESGMFVREPAWHRGGNVVQEYPQSWEEAKKLADLNFQPIPGQVFVEVQMDNGARLTMPAPEHKAVLRSDNHDVLTIQSSGYAIIDNDEFGQIVDYVLGRDEDMPMPKLESLVVLKGGRVITATITLDEPIEVPGDSSPTLPMLVASIRHDGRGGMKLGPSGIRVVCMNTQQIAEMHMDATGLGFTIRHTANWADRLAAARLALGGSMGALAAYKDVAVHLGSTPLGTGAVDDFLDMWMPYSTDQTEGQRAGVARRRSKFQAIFDNEHGTHEGMQSTKWKLLQAAYEYADHFVNHRSNDSQVAKQLVTGDPSKAKALAIIGGM